MADRNVESDELGVPQIDETLEILLLQAIEEAQDRMEAGSEVVPFTALLNGETVTEDTHTGTTEECFESARKTVEAATGARAYVLCYDGYIDTDSGEYMENNDAGWDYSDEYYDDYDPWSDPGDGWDDYAYDDEGWGDYF